MRSNKLKATNHAYWIEWVSGRIFLVKVSAPAPSSTTILHVASNKRNRDGYLAKNVITIRVVCITKLSRYNICTFIKKTKWPVPNKL